LGVNVLPHEARSALELDRYLTGVRVAQEVGYCKLEGDAPASQISDKSRSETDLRCRSQLGGEGLLESKGCRQEALDCPSIDRILRLIEDTCCL
jgi:hypothetical protein